ncbi:MAG: hypothetical protein MR227_03095 [Firmicutes bacterium]|nr:hypothetical protein [Bacillota bacterium]
MKKLLLVIFLIINIFFINYKVENTDLKVVAINDNTYKLYKLNTKLTTKNILNYINEEIKIIAIYPKTKLTSYVYTFTNSTNQNNLILFTNEYRNLLRNNNYNKEANLISFNGIEIDKIIVSTTANNIERLLKTNKFILE